MTRTRAVEGGAQASPRLLYCERRQRACGSGYKYPALISHVAHMDRAETNNPAGVRRACEAHRPDMLLVRGDNSKLYAGATVPYLLIEHDVGSIRGNGSEAHEHAMLSGAAGVLFTSPLHRQYCEERYPMRNVIEIPLEPLARDIIFAQPEKVPNSTVYCGGIRADADGHYGYRALHDIFARILATGRSVHLYRSHWTSTQTESYSEMGVTVHDAVPQRELYAELAKYEVGLQVYGHGGAKTTNYPDWCMPNKTFEYRGAGIPTLGYNTANGYVYDGKWGVWCQDDDLEGALDKAQAMTVPDEYRYLTIDRHAGEVARWIREAWM